MHKGYGRHLYPEIAVDPLSAKLARMFNVNVRVKDWQGAASRLTIEALEALYALQAKLPKHA